MCLWGSKRSWLSKWWFGWSVAALWKNLWVELWQETKGKQDIKVHWQRCSAVLLFVTSLQGNTQFSLSQKTYSGINRKSSCKTLLLCSCQQIVKNFNSYWSVASKSFPGEMRVFISILQMEKQSRDAKTNLWNINLPLRPPQEKTPKCSDFWVTVGESRSSFLWFKSSGTAADDASDRNFPYSKVRGATVTPSGWMCQSAPPFFPSFQEVESEGTRCDWQLWLARPTLKISRDLPFSFQPPTTFCFLLKVVDEIWNSSSHLPTPFAFLAYGGGCSSPSWSLGGWAVSDQAYCFQLGALGFL